MFLLFVPMLVVLLIRPQGLFGRAAQGQPRRVRPRPLIIPLPSVLFHIQTLARRYSFPLFVGTRGDRLGPARWRPSHVFGLRRPHPDTVAYLVPVWIGLNVMLGYGGMPSLGHALFFGAGAYTVAWSYFAGLSGLAGCGLAILTGLIAGLRSRARRSVAGKSSFCSSPLLLRK